MTHRLAEGRSAWQVVSEVVGQTYVGTGTPDASVSPMQLSVGARRDVSSATSFGVHLFAALSARPAERVLDEYVLIQPRVGGELSLQMRLGLPDEPLPAKKEEVEESNVEGDDADNPPEAEPGPQEVRGVVTDEAGEPLPDVLVQLRVDGSEMQEMRTYADGSFVFIDVQAAPSQLTVSASGFAESKFAWTSPEDMPDKFVLSTAAPAGQLKGTVRALSGEAVAAQITVEPDGEPQLANEKGEFELELAPGRHQVRITAEGYLAQKRSVVIRNRGVVILNISLMPDKSRSESSDQDREP